MPSSTGIFTSVSSRSYSPPSLSAPSAAPPSAVAVNSWPSSSRARIRSSRMASSSSAIRILAMMSWPYALFHARLDVARGKEAHHHVGGVGGRRGKAAAKFKRLAGVQNAARRQSRPGVDFLPCCAARGKPQARHRNRLFAVTDDDALDDQNVDTVLRLFRNVDVFEFEMAQVDRQADRGEQRGGLWQIAHDLVARAHHRDVDRKQHEH